MNDKLINDLKEKIKNISDKDEKQLLLDCIKQLSQKDSLINHYRYVVNRMERKTHSQEEYYIETLQKIQDEADWNDNIIYEICDRCIYHTVEMPCTRSDDCFTIDHLKYEKDITRKELEGIDELH